MARFDRPCMTIPACHGQTDGRTDRITISISRDSSSMLTRDKNLSKLSAGVTTGNIE